MNILLYKEFSKRRNSTKQPTNETSVPKDVKLKDKCSILNPSFFLADAEQYVYLKAWDYYYFIDSVEYDINGASYIRCSIDVLASFKADILRTSAFVKYSSSDYDVNIIDTRITQKVTSEYAINDYTYDETPLFRSDGCFIMSVTNDTNGLTHYVMDSTAFAGFMHDMLNASMTIIEGLVLRYGKLMDSIMSVRWLPLGADELPIVERGVNIEIGMVNFEATADRTISYPTIGKGMDITIPWKYDDFRRHGTYTTIYVTLPYVGRVEIDPMEIMGIDTLRVRYLINCLTGTADVFITKESLTGEKIVTTLAATIGRSIPVSATSIDSEGAMAGAAMLVGAATDIYAGIATDYPTITEEEFLRDSKTSINAMLKGVMARIKGSTSTVGSYSGSAYERSIWSPIVEVMSRDCRTEPSELTALYGRPCDKVRTMSSLSGYVETRGFFINISSLKEIKEKINKQMDTGVYLE